MIGEWRILLRQAEDALRCGRLEEALSLVKRPELAERREVVTLRDRTVRAVLARGHEHIQNDRSEAAWRDVAMVEASDVTGADLESLRAELTKRVVAEMDVYLQSGDPRAVVQLGERFGRRRIESAEVRRRTEVAELWTRARQEVRAGDFSSALENLQVALRLMPELGELDQDRRECVEHQARVATHTRELQDAVQAREWAGAIRAADAILAISPDAAEARRARRAAWQELGIAVTQAAPAVESVDSKGDTDRPRAGACFVLWIDGIGGYWLCCGDQVVIGQAEPGNRVDLPVLGDISRRHAVVHRDGEGYVLRSEREVAVNGRPGRELPLRDGDAIRLGRSVALRFRQPNPASLTARLEFTSFHRLPISVQSILLMDQNCVIADTTQAHIRGPGLMLPILLCRQGDSLWCQVAGDVEIDGQVRTCRAPLQAGSKVRVGEFSFSLESVNAAICDA